MENLNKPLNEALEELEKQWEKAHNTTVQEELNKAKQPEPEKR